MHFNNFGKRYKSYAKAVESNKSKPMQIIKDKPQASKNKLPSYKSK